MEVVELDLARLHAAVEERGRDAAVVVDDDSERERAVDRLLDVTVPVLLVHRARTVHDLEDLPDLVRVDLLGHHDLDGRVDLLGEQTTGPLLGVGGGHLGLRHLEIGHRWLPCLMYSTVLQR